MISLDDERVSVVYPATSDSTAVVKESGANGVLLLLKTGPYMATAVEDKGFLNPRRFLHSLA
jgi:hypothetical protein